MKRQKKSHLLNIPLSFDAAALITLFEPSSKEYFLRLFKSDFIGKVALDDLVEQGAIDSDSLEWNTKVANKNDLAAVLRYINGIPASGENFGLFSKRHTYIELSEIARKAFSVHISAATIKNAKGKSNFVERLKRL